MIPVFRPTLLDSKQDSDGCSEQLASLVRRCWAEDHNERPDFSGVKTALKRISKSVQFYSEACLLLLSLRDRPRFYAIALVELASKNFRVYSNVC